MPGLDRVQYTSLEQLRSSDMNTDARLRGRGVMEVFRQALATAEGNTDNATSDPAITSPRVIGGLKVIPGIGGVIVGTGLLMQTYAAGVAPEADESQWVYGELRVAQDVAIAIPVSDTWYLIQARATTTQTNGTRDIWNPGTEAFDATAVPVKLENTIELQAKVGTTENIPMPDAGWVPLGGVLRFSSGADSTLSELIDLRPLYDRKTVSLSSGRVGSPNGFLQTSHYDSENPVADNTLSFSLESPSDFGDLYARSMGFVDLTDPAVLDPSTALAANTWYYLYLACWARNQVGGVCPRQAYGNVVSNGILVLSHVPPGAQGSALMPSGVTLPAPFAQDSGRFGVCVSAVLRNSANNGWCSQIQVNGRSDVFRYFPDTLLTWTAGVVPTALGSGKIPVNAKTVSLEIERDTGTTTTFTHILTGATAITKTLTQTTGQRQAVRVPLVGLPSVPNLLMLSGPGADLMFLYLAGWEF